ncbi:choice-of-anchor L family PEP-CTERM protein [Kamptonema formosum]|uniref:choice-of-anchor L family PEP-CTERM protein n=1 Tax=Kamptonema formosum TaxID=331992 RepID=UPI00034DE2A2|nr:choice-of-anchor L domain-containing protein [Oscillatoria sp. PCC 10802]
MKLLRRTFSGAAAALTASLSIAGAPAFGFTITQNSNGSDLLNSLLGTTTGLSNFSVTTTGNAAAFGLFTGDPFGLGSGVALSTGYATALLGPNNSGSKSGSFGTSGDTPGSYDLAKLEISFDADSTADKVFFQYVFGSEEFVEYGGSSYNDSFELLLNGTNLAKLSDGQTVTINNLVPNPGGPYHPDFTDNTGGIATNDTQLDGFTKVLAFEGLLNKNAKNTLSIKIKDVGDSGWDSGVFIKGGSLGTVAPPSKVPEPGVVFGLLAAGSMGFLSGRKKQKAVNS